MDAASNHPGGHVEDRVVWVGNEATFGHEIGGPQRRLLPAEGQCPCELPVGDHADNTGR